MILTVVGAFLFAFLGIQALLFVFWPNKFGELLAWLSRDPEREPIAIAKGSARLIGVAGLLIWAVAAVGFFRP